MSETYLYEVLLFKVKDVIYNEVVIFDNYIATSLQDCELYRDEIILNQLKNKVAGKKYIPIKHLVVLTEEELFYLKLTYDFEI